MDYQKITNLLGNMPDKVPRFITKKWIEVHDQSGTAEDRYKPSKQIRLKTSMLRSDLCNYSDAYIVVEGVVTVSAEERDGDEMNRDFALKNNAPFISCMSKINGVLTENAEDLDVLMTMYNLLELTNEANDNNGPNKNVINSRSIKYKASITGRTYNVAGRVCDEDGNLEDNPDYDQSKRGTKKV